MPVFFSVLQVILMVTVFKYNTPVELKERKDFENMTALFNKVYIKEHVEWRMAEVSVKKESGHTDEDPSEEVTLKVAGTTYSETFCDPNLRAAAWVGCALSIF